MATETATMTATTMTKSTKARRQRGGGGGGGSGDGGSGKGGSGGQRVGSVTLTGMATAAATTAVLPRRAAAVAMCHRPWPYGGKHSLLKAAIR